MALENKTPTEIDTELARLYGAKLRIAAPIALVKSVKAEIRKYERFGYPAKPYQLERLAKAERRAAVALKIIGRINRELETPLNDEFSRRGGWTRFFVVGGGHIHLRGCHTLRPTTLLGWLPEDSGADELKTVAKHGKIACTHCFPTAPVEDKPTELIVNGKCTSKSWKPLPNGGSDYRRCYRYGLCPHCGTVASITKADNLRSHKVKA